MELNLSNEDRVKIILYLTEQEEKDNVLGDIEPFDITGW